MGSTYRICVCFTRRFRITKVDPPPDVKEAFKKYSDGGAHMTAEQFRRFLAEIQGEASTTIAIVDAERIVEQVLHKQHHIAKFTRHTLTLDDLHHPIGSQCTSMEGGSETMDLIACRIIVWWPMDKQFYEGVVKPYDPQKKKHVVLYDDGDVEVLCLDKERWELIDDDRKPTKEFVKFELGWGDLTSHWKPEESTIYEFKEQSIDWLHPFNVNTDSHLKTLDLAQNQLTSEIPRLIYWNEVLQYLGLRGNSLTGTLSTDMCQLTGLWYFDVRCNNLTGTIPDSIDNCTSFEILDISYNQITKEIPYNIGFLQVATLMVYHQKLFERTWTYVVSSRS